MTSFVQGFADLSGQPGPCGGIARDLNLVDSRRFRPQPVQSPPSMPTTWTATSDGDPQGAAAAVVPPAAVVLFGTSAALAVVTGYAPA